MPQQIQISTPQQTPFKILDFMSLFFYKFLIIITIIYILYYIEQKININKNIILRLKIHMEKNQVQDSLILIVDQMRKGNKKFIQQIGLCPQDTKKQQNTATLYHGCNNAQFHQSHVNDQNISNSAAFPNQKLIKSQGFIYGSPLLNQHKQCRSAIICLCLTVIIEDTILTFGSFPLLGFFTVVILFWCFIQIIIFLLIMCDIKNGKASYKKVRICLKSIIFFSVGQILWSVGITLFSLFYLKKIDMQLIQILVVIFIVNMVPKLIAICIIKSRKLQNHHIQHPSLKIID